MEARKITKGYQYKQGRHVVWTAEADALVTSGGGVRVVVRWDTGEIGNRFFKEGEKVADNG